MMDILKKILSIFSKKQQNFEGFIYIPIVVYYATEEDKLKHQEGVENGIDFANTLFFRAFVSFYIDKHIVVEFDKKYVHEKHAINFERLSNGKFSIFITEGISYKEKKNLLGLAWSSRDYSRRYNIISCPISRIGVIAHELGHSLGLIHAESKNNVMYEYISVVENINQFTEAQSETIRNHAEYYFSVIN